MKEPPIVHFSTICTVNRCTTPGYLTLAGQDKGYGVGFRVLLALRSHGRLFEGTGTFGDFGFLATKTLVN